MQGVSREPEPRDARLCRLLEGAAEGAACGYIQGPGLPGPELAERCGLGRRLSFLRLSSLDRISKVKTQKRKKEAYL